MSISPAFRLSADFAALFGGQLERCVADMTAEIKRRSPQQIARMERAMGLHE